ncbi:nitrogen fixation protein NifZ [Corallincola platygyrae]|uniref:Nitrogen fixation protein NifZ n=1 Tax=Corallincola platygyrae TaxID=1193278 RepID=A0ABW4XGA6_9GAMM
MFGAKFETGDKVRLIRNIRDDGSYHVKAAGKSGTAHQDKGKLLVRRGELGYVRHVGVFLQDQIIYQVHFIDIDKVVGCRERELIDGELAWQPNAFEYGDDVELSISLSSDGVVFAKAGDSLSILGVYRSDMSETESSESSPVGPEYRVQWQDRELLLPERAIRFKQKEGAVQ